MGASDGTVLGITKILDNGPNNNRHNIVLVAEGFQDSEQDDFNDLCDQFIDYLMDEPWYPELGLAINLFRLNVSSTESGADDPEACPDGSDGSGASPATYFDAGFCKSGVRRCLSGDYFLVRNTLDDQLLEWTTAAVLVNTTQRGGCASGNVFFAAISSDWREVVMHELGHAAFNLADEYNYRAGCDIDGESYFNAPASEPSRRNITNETDREQVKWSFFISPAVPVPTMENPDCSVCDERDNVLDDELTIGLFEGADYYHCGRYRPAYRCKMRKSSQPFCRVCIDAIAEELREFIDNEPTVEVVPTLLDFGEVAYGLTMYRAFEVRNVKSGPPVGLDITLSALTGDASFAYVPGADLSFRIPAPVYEPYLQKRIYVAYTSSDDGTPVAFASLTVDSPEAADGAPQTVELIGQAIEPPPVDSVLVIDRSDSMSGDTGIPGETKSDHAIAAAQLYISLLKENDRVGIVRYNDLARDPEDILLNMTLADAGGKGTALGVLTGANLSPSGFTSIGGGIILGSGVLDAGTADNRALVVLTDGIQNRNPDIPEATAEVLTKSPQQRVFAVGFGLNQLEDRLEQIASVTNGVAQITGELVDQKEFLLQKLYVQILSDVSDEAFVRDPKQVVLPGERKATNIYLGEVDVAADFIVVFRRSAVFPKYMRVVLEMPDGTLIRETDVPGIPTVRLVRQVGHLYYRVQFPVFPDRPAGHIGRWKVWVENLSGRRSEYATSAAAYNPGVPLFCSVMAKARSDFRLGGHVEQATYLPGSIMGVVLEPTLYGLPVELLEPVQMTVTRPNGTQGTLYLTRNEDGLYRTDYSNTGLLGVYLFSTEVAARTPRNQTITRFRQMTGIIFRPNPPGSGGTGGQDGGDGRDKCCEELIKRVDRLTRIIEQKKDC